MRSSGTSDGVSLATTEKTPVMRQSDVEEGSDPRSPRGNIKHGGRPRDRLKHAAAIKARQAQEKQESMWKFMIYCCGAFWCLVIVGVIYWIYSYYNRVYESREEIDNKPTVLSETCIDYMDPLQRRVNCTNTHPCVEWDCKYVDEHFHRTPEECEYKDYLTVVTILLILCLLCTTCSLIKEYC